MPRIKRPTRHVLAVGLVGVLLLAGCSTVPTGGLSDADAISDHVQNRYDRIDSYSATVTKTVETPSETARVRARLDVDTGERIRITYRSGPHAGTTESVDLSASASGQPVLSTSMQRASSGQAVSYDSLAESLVRTNNVSLERTTTLRGHAAAVVSLTPPADANATVRVERRLWIDTERLIPLRIETTWTAADGRTVTETVTYTNVTVREGNESASGQGGVVA